VGGAQHRGHDTKFTDSSQTCCCRHYSAGGGTGDWRDKWAGHGIADMTPSSMLALKHAVVTISQVAVRATGGTSGSHAASRT